MHTQEISPARLPAKTDARRRAGALCFRLLAASAALMLVYRIVLMAVLPLADTTEARYGEIARLTVTHGFWLMPHLYINLPFWAKPPLSTWAAAVSMLLFGINEFAARLPSLLASVATAGFAMAFAGQLGLRRRWLVLPVLATSPLFFISAGAVMTDAVQMIVVTAALYCAWRVLAPAAGADPDGGRQRWRLAFWIVVGVGALSKGLADWALIGLPLTLYAILEGRPVALFLRIFSWAGAAIAACIFVPWYAAAEYTNPGFLHYFIIGEHFSRFLIPGWKGDRYGFAHEQPLGMIWVFWVAAILPWTGVFAAEFLRFARRVRAAEPLERFLWSATLAPLLFFTFAHNIIWTYGLTGLVPFSILAARWLDRATDGRQAAAGWGLFALAIAFLLCAPTIARNVNGNSDRQLVAAFTHAAPPDATLVYTIKPGYSSSFYARGRLRYRADGTLPPKQGNAPRFVVMDNKDLAKAGPDRRVIFTGTRHSLIEVQ